MEYITKVRELDFCKLLIYSVGRLEQSVPTKKTKGENKMYNLYENYKMNDKGQSQVVFKEIYKEGTYLNSAHYKVNHPEIDNDWGCAESDWGFNSDVAVRKTNTTASVQTDHFVKEEKEVFELSFWKNFATDRSTCVDVYLNREQLELIVEEATKALNK